MQSESSLKFPSHLLHQFHKLDVCGQLRISTVVFRTSCFIDHQLHFEILRQAGTFFLGGTTETEIESHFSILLLIYYYQKYLTQMTMLRVILKPCIVHRSIGIDHYLMTCTCVAATSLRLTLILENLKYKNLQNSGLKKDGHFNFYNTTVRQYNLNSYSFEIY